VTELDALRGIAVLLVVFYHYFYRYAELYNPEVSVGVARYGHLGVELFFLISGFVIFYSLLHAKSLQLFWVGRVARIIPAYWFSVVLIYAATSMVGLEGRTVSGNDFVANLSLLQEYLGFKHVDGVYWSLTIEITFYFWVSLLMIRYRQYAQYLFLVYPLILLAVQFFDVDMSRKLEKLFLVEYGSLFLAGICYSNLHQENMGKRSLFVLFVCMLINTFHYVGVELMIVLFFHFLMLIVALGKASFLSIKPLVYIGGLSYSIYLIHQNIGYILLNNLSVLTLPYWLLTAVVSSVVVLGSHFMVEYVEKPSRNLITQRFGKKHAA
tara:strand:+ start:285 stop:1256 length:972 start_codon:yes stop_codon:yes gene_type:complete